MKVLLVNGSPNKEGCTYVALNQIRETLKEENINVPKDVSIISVDDTIIAEAYNITSVAHAKGLIGKYAAECILSGQFKTQIYNPEITLRSSVKNIIL